MSDVNEFPPRFLADSVRASVAEGEAAGTEVRRKEQREKIKKCKLAEEMNAIPT